MPEESKAVSMSLREIEAVLEKSDTQIIGMVRNNVRLTILNPWHKIRAGDILILEAEAKTLTDALSTLGLKLEEAIPSTEKNKIENSDKDGNKEDTKADKEDDAGSDEIVLRDPVK